MSGMQSVGIVVAIVGAGGAVFSRFGSLVVIGAGLLILAVGLRHADWQRRRPCNSHHPADPSIRAHHSPRRHHGDRFSLVARSYMLLSLAISLFAKRSTGAVTPPAGVAEK